MKRLHRIQSLFLVLTLVAACQYSLAQNQTQHRDPCHRRNDRWCGGTGTQSGYTSGALAIDTMVNAVPGYREAGKHQGRADFECRIAGHVVRHHAEAGQADQ